MFWTLWQWASVGCVLISVGGFAWLWQRSRMSLRRDFLFLVFAGSTVVYLQLAPTLTVLGGDIPSLLGRDVAPTVRDYVGLELTCLAFFQIPLVALYLGWRGGTGGRPRTAFVVHPGRARILARSSVVWVLAFAFALYRNDYLFTRIGSEGASAKVLALPPLDYVIIRGYQTSALFLIATLYVLRLRTTSPQLRGVLSRALGVNLGIWLLYSVVNSRAAVLVTALLLLGISLACRQDLPRVPKRLLIRLALVGVVAVYGMVVTTNIRTGFSGALTVSPRDLTQLSSAAVSDAPIRLNCVNLMSQLKPGVVADGPSWGGAWAPAKWYVWRYVDPEGFDEFRASLRTSAKAHLMAEFLGFSPPDYYSCALTDLYGNFDVGGLLGGAVLFGGIFLWWARQSSRPASGRRYLLALFAVTHALLFDQEAMFVMFGWLPQLPFVAAIIALGPLVVERLETSPPPAPEGGDPEPESTPCPACLAGIPL